MVMTSLDIEDEEYNRIKDFCLKQGYTLKGLFLNGANRIIKENAKKEAR